MLNDPRGETLAAMAGDYLEAVLGGHRLEAVDIAVAALDAGVGPEVVIGDVIADAQAQVGLRWQPGEINTAVEHRASGIAESALRAVTDTAMRAPGVPREGSAGRAVVACTEGEWHMLPGRMAAEVLRLRGVDVTFIGPSVPATDLAALIGDDPPPVVAVSCSMPMSLVGSWHTISALRALGTTVVSGGRGFGRDGAWARALGADHWAPNFSRGADMVVRAALAPPPDPRPPSDPCGAAAELRILRRDHAALVEAAMRVCIDRWPGLSEVDAALIATREDLGYTLQAIASAVLVGDEGLLVEFVRWFQDVLAARHLPVDFATSANDVLLQVLPKDLTAARAKAACGLTVRPLSASL
jgi:methanogenic corrinoid protein MtbC1